MGLSDEFPEDKARTRDGVLVQPNYEIVFLEPSASTEAALSPFAQRVAHGVGVLFRLSADSIRGAFGRGLGADDILGVLLEVSDGPLPGNVEKQVRDWVESCRTIRSRASILLDCGDPETALRIKAMASGKVNQLTETILELKSAQARREMERKLAKQGIFWQ